MAVSDFKEYLTQQGMTVFECDVNVFIGGDTRPSTPELLELVARGIEYAKGKPINFGLTTTPQLQYYGT
jgi:phosphomannomutase